MAGTHPSPRQTLLEISRQFVRGKLLCAAVRLGIADALGDSEKSLDELVTIVKSDRDGLYRFLRAMAAMGLVREVAPARFVLTEFGRPLRRDVPESVWASMIFWPHLLADSWGFLADCVRAGSNKGAEDAMNRDGIQSAWSREPNVGAIFHSVFAEPDGTEMADFAAAYDFSKSKVVADLGGAGGGLLTAILQANPHLRGILVDQPQAMSGASDKFASAGLTDRCDLRPGDLKESVPPGADIYILKAVLHGYADDHARAILTNVRKVISREHRLLIIEVVLPDKIEHADPILERQLLADLNMLVATGGRERSETEWRNLLASTGFQCRRVIPVDGQEACIVEASLGA